MGSSVQNELLSVGLLASKTAAMLLTRQLAAFELLGITPAQLEAQVKGDPRLARRAKEVVTFWLKQLIDEPPTGALSSTLAELHRVFAAPEPEPAGLRLVWDATKDQPPTSES